MKQKEKLGKRKQTTTEIKTIKQAKREDLIEITPEGHYYCKKHGAMNCIKKDLTLYRCTACGIGIQTSSPHKTLYQIKKDSLCGIIVKKVSKKNPAMQILTTGNLKKGDIVELIEEPKRFPSIRNVSKPNEPNIIYQPIKEDMEKI